MCLIALVLTHLSRELDFFFYIKMSNKQLSLSDPLSAITSVLEALDDLLNECSSPLDKCSRQVVPPFFLSRCFLMMILTGRFQPPPRDASDPIPMKQGKNRKEVTSHCRAIITNILQFTPWTFQSHYSLGHLLFKLNFYIHSRNTSHQTSVKVSLSVLKKRNIKEGRVIFDQDHLLR